MDGITRVNKPLLFRWYAAAIPYDLPEFHDSVSRTAGELRPKSRKRGGDYLNAMGDGRKGRLAWMHTQIGSQPTWYLVEAEMLKPGTVPQHLPPQGWSRSIRVLPPRVTIESRSGRGEVDHGWQGIDAHTVGYCSRERVEISSRSAADVDDRTWRRAQETLEDTAAHLGSLIVRLWIKLFI